MENLHLASQVIDRLKAYEDQEKAKVLKSFFKTQEGEYAQGDRFWGINVLSIRKLARAAKEMKFKEVIELIRHEVHEVRMAGLLILVDRFPKSNKQVKQDIFELYLANLKYINNWDLVDVTCPNIVGNFLLDKDRTLLYELARSNDLWERRIAIISTFAFIKKNDFDDALKIATVLLDDEHDLINKAVGWMLREVYKREHKLILDFLDEYAATMPRVALRYSIEKMDEPLRLHYLHLKTKMVKLK